MTWWHAVAEARHELQNPTSAEKILRLGEALALGPESRVLDVAARERIEAAGLGRLIEVVEADAATADYEPGADDAAPCLGASFVFGGLAETVAALAPAVRPAGFVAVGEPYSRSSEPYDEFVPLAETVACFEAAGPRLVTAIRSSDDDWAPEHPQAEEFRELDRRRRDEYLRRQRDGLGWAILVGRR